MLKAKKFTDRDKAIKKKVIPTQFSDPKAWGGYQARYRREGM
jgi:hypothetical protein